MRHSRACVALAAVPVAFVACALTQSPMPTRARPIAACVISSPNGFTHRRQHIARGGHRYFTDVRLIGEYVTRGADGEILTNNWIACVGQLKPDGWCSETADYDKQDVELGACSNVIHQIVISRSVEERGQYPGEDESGHPLPPP